MFFVLTTETLYQINVKNVKRKKVQKALSSVTINQLIELMNSLKENLKEKGRGFALCSELPAPARTFP